MIVEFIGGSKNGIQKRISTFLEYIISDVENEIYYAKIIRYNQLGWLYVWYEYSGNLSGQMVSA